VIAGRRRAGLAALLSIACAASAQVAVIDAQPLPLATKRIAASSDECAVWRREQAFSRSVEAHDLRAFQSFLHSGTVFDAGTADADRGSEAVTKGWAEIVEGRTIALRWRPGIVHIGGEPTIALSRGPYILQRLQAGAPIFRVGMYQTVWLRDGRDGAWRVLFDGSATTGQTMADRAVAERWVEEQAMSDCAS
jgi:ketosteroid isomerase-like protein